jgi:formylglycine-generating enzyme required for sulfatase activity
MLSLQKSVTEEGLIGEMKDNTLIPSVISLGRDTIAIGTHEVTLAQYHAYTGNTFDRLRANQPVTGLAKEEITAYLSWLSSKTGDTYRLPNEAEARSLHKTGRKNFQKQNNLNHWAGYELTSLDVPGLQDKLEELRIPLIKNAGSHTGVKLKKDVLIYDLGGNVAEYYTAAQALKTYDYSAYDFVDPVTTENKASEARTGFRVIRE